MPQTPHHAMPRQVPRDALTFVTIAVRWVRELPPLCEAALSAEQLGVTHDPKPVQPRRLLMSAVCASAATRCNA